jgi:hypothetical protein
MADPPSDVGDVQDTAAVNCPAVAVTPVGAPGTLAIVTAVEDVDWA